jgi:hypothetical protein
MADIKSTEYNQNSGVFETLAIQDGKLIDHVSADITALIEKNKYKQNNESSLLSLSNSQGANYKQVAELDMVTVHRLLSEYNIDVFNPDHMPRLKKWLNLSDNKFFKTTNGRI